jgi:hypothetical protein
LQLDSPSQKQLLALLAADAKSYATTSSDLERNCWLAVHRYHHGVLPSEYDIREIPEDLYLELLAYCRSLEAGK